MGGEDSVPHLEVSQGPVVRLGPPGSVHQQEVVSHVVSTVLRPQHGLAVQVDDDEARGLTGRDAGGAPDRGSPDWVDGVAEGRVVVMTKHSTSHPVWA